jgi:AcrR family transcriptional regulator
MNKPRPARAPPSRRDARYHHGDLRSALLAAALAVIGEVGPRGLTIREVARRAGVSHAAPYRHFGDRDELVLAVAEQGFTLLQQTMEQRRAEAAPDPVSQFAASGFAYVEFALRHPDHYRIMFSGNLLSRSGQYSLQHTSEGALQDMIGSIRQCQDLGIVRPGDAVHQALAVWSLIHGFVSLVNDRRLDSLLDGDRLLEQTRDAVLLAIFAGIGTIPSAAPEPPAVAAPRRARSAQKQQR